MQELVYFGIDEAIRIIKCGFYLPDNARYDKLLNLPEEENLALKIKEAMIEIEKYSPDLAGVLPKDDYYTINSSEDKSLLKKLLKNFKDIPDDISIDIFGEIYEYFLGEFALSEGQGGGEFFTPSTVVRYMVEVLAPTEGKILDPCMGSGHILVYAFDVLMQIYESCGYSQRDAAKSILENNIYGLDIDNRAYQLAYFALMMKARQYNRRILNGETDCHVYSIQESNEINRDHMKYLGAGLSDIERNIALPQLNGLLDTFIDAKEYGSILNVDNYNWELLRSFVGSDNMSGQLALDAVGIDETKEQLGVLVEIGEAMARKYDVVVTNPPYMGNGGMGGKLSAFVNKYYRDTKSDMFSCCIEKGFLMAKASGFISMITMESWMFLSSFEKMRHKIITQKNVTNLVHMLYLGKGGTSLGISFGTSTFVFTNTMITNIR